MEIIKQFTFLIWVSLSLLSCESRKTVDLFQNINLENNVAIVFSEIPDKKILIYQKERLQLLRDELQPKIIIYKDWRDYATTPYGEIEIYENGVEKESYILIDESDLLFKNNDTVSLEIFGFPVIKTAKQNTNALYISKNDENVYYYVAKN